MSVPNTSPRAGGSSSRPTDGTNTTPSAANSVAQTLLPLVSAVAQSATSSVERSLDRHFSTMLQQQQQLVTAVQQLAGPRARASSLPATSMTPPTGQWVVSVCVPCRVHAWGVRKGCQGRRKQGLQWGGGDTVLSRPEGLQVGPMVAQSRRGWGGGHVSPGAQYCTVRARACQRWQVCMERGLASSAG